MARLSSNHYNQRHASIQRNARYYVKHSNGHHYGHTRIGGIVLIPATFIANKKRNKTAWLDGYEHASHIHGTPTDRNQIASDHPITTSGWQLKRGEMFTDGYLSALTDLSLPYNQIDQQECVHNHYYAKDNALTIASSVNNAATRLHH